MENAVATKDTNTALADLTPDEAAALKADRERMGGQFPSIPKIRLANKDMDQAPEGEYFIEERVGDQTKVTPIGKNPVVTILYKTNTYSYFTKENGLIAWTSDIHGFTDLDNVTLYKKVGDTVVIDFDGVYPAFKKHMEAKYTTVDPVTEKKKKLLTFKTVLYLRYNGEIYKMFVSNASSAGVDANGNPSFESPAAKSLQVLMDSYWKQKRASYEFSLMLGSAFVKSSKPYYIMQFSSLNELDSGELKLAMKASYGVRKSVFAMDDARKAYNMQAQEQPGQPVRVDLESDIKPEDLPF